MEWPDSRNDSSFPQFSPEICFFLKASELKFLEKATNLHGLLSVVIVLPDFSYKIPVFIITNNISNFSF